MNHKKQEVVCRQD